jgi:predicted O-methyltransferase YrrM
MTNLWAFLADAGVVPSEGSATGMQLSFLMELASRPEVRKIGEIGFNAGVSSDGFLRANAEATVVSFDIGEYKHVRLAKNFIDREFPGRHELVLGDSTVTVPRFARERLGYQFDLIFIDGGHEYTTTAADLRHASRLSGSRTVVVVDDLLPWVSYGAGPACAWYEAVATGLMRQDALVKDGEVVARIEPPAERAWGVGGYLGQRVS